MTRGDPGSLPTTSPYAADLAPVSAIPSNVVDWVLVECAAPMETQWSRKAPFWTHRGRFSRQRRHWDHGRNFAAGYYSIVVKHRNHLAVMSAQPVAFTNYLVTYDFTTGAKNIAAARCGGATGTRCVGHDGRGCRRGWPRSWPWMAVFARTNWDKQATAARISTSTVSFPLTTWRSGRPTRDTPPMPPTVRRS